MPFEMAATWIVLAENVQLGRSHTVSFDEWFLQVETLASATEIEGP